jgi:hypothetical protein
MSNYYVNKNAQVNGDHEVHKEGCSFMPTLENRTYLGNFITCRDAVNEAKKTYATANGCYFCSYDCHTS